VFDVPLGSKLERQDVPSTTGTTDVTHQRVNETWDRAMGTEDPMRGNPLGGRATATEAQNVFERGSMPAVEQAEYLADQLFEPMFIRSAELWLQYGDPEKMKRITGLDVPVDMMYLPFKVRITTVMEYENNAMTRRQVTTFLGAAYDKMAVEATPEGRKKFWRETVWPAFKWGGADSIFGTAAVYDAEMRATQESYNLMAMGETEPPQPNEDHATHLAIHKNYKQHYDLGRGVDRDWRPEVSRAFEEHIMLHEQLQQAQAGGDLQAPAEETGAFLEGQQLGDELAGPMGATEGGIQ